MRKPFTAIVMKSLFSAVAGRAAFLLVALGFCLCAAVPAAAASDAPNPRPVLVVGGDHDCAPYEFVENGRATGFNIDLMRAVAETMGFDVRFRLGPWIQVRRELDQGKIDALAGMFYSAERGQSVDFSVPHTMVTSGVFVRSDSPIRAFGDMQGKIVIVQDGDIIHEYLRESGLPAHIVAVAEVGQGLRLLASGRYDCAMSPSLLQGEHLIKSMGLANIRVVTAGLPRLRYCFAVRKGNLDLLSELDEGLNLLKADGTYQAIHEKWFGVYERTSLWKSARVYVYATIAGVLALCAAALVWSRSLRLQVRIRTAELREREEQFRVLAETSPSAICLFQDDRIVYVNPALSQLFGYSEQECLQMKFWEWAHRDYQALVKSRGFARQRGEEVANRYECRHITKGGEEKWVLVTAGRIEYKGRPAGLVTFADISERKLLENELEKRVEERTEELGRATEALMASEKEKSLILNITDALVLFYDLDMNILWANRAAGDSVQIPPEALRGRRCWEVWHQRQEPCVGCPVLAARDTGRPHEMEARTPDQRVWHVRAYPVKDETGRLIGMVEFTQDFTERKQMEEALRQASLVVENSPVVLFRWQGDEAWPVELVSGNVAQFGYVPDEFLSGTIAYASIIHPDDLARVIREVKGYCDEGADQFCLEYRIVTKGGEVRWVSEHTNIERDGTSAVVNFEGIVIDITARKSAEVELERQRASLQELNSTLEKRVREEVAKNREKDVLLIQQSRQAAMGELLEHIAHQWKQPLTVVSLIVQNLWLQFANSELTAATVRETIDAITELLEHMGQTIEDFRDFYRPDKEETVFLVKDSVDNALAFIAPALKHEAITVAVDIAPDLLAQGYPRQYVQVILNLLTNARDALIERKIAGPSIRIQGFAEESRAVVTIADNAGGIAESILPEIFDLYVTTKQARGGTGIGLHMSKNIIEKNMAGELRARNTACGALFRIAVNRPTSGDHDGLRPGA